MFWVSARRFFGFFILVLRLPINLWKANLSAWSAWGSHFSGFRNGARSMRVDLAPASLARRSTSAAKSRPALSLSGQRITSLPSSGEKSNLWTTRSDSIPAPPTVQVAAMPIPISASAYFSPSALIVVFAFKMIVILFRCLGSGWPMHPYYRWRDWF